MRLILILFILTYSLQAAAITVATAANVGYAMKDLTTAFHKLHPTLHVKVIIGSSGKLSAQIRNNAPYDLFLSANMGYAQKLFEDGYATTKPIIYVKGKLVLFSKTPRDLSDALTLLTHKEIKKIAIANPKTAPYGVAAKEALQNAGIYNILKPKFVYGESISQTTLYALRSTDVGIISKSSLFVPQMLKYKKNKNWIDISTDYYTPIKQGMVILKYGKNNEAVKSFYNFLQTKEAKDIFEKFGYEQGN